MVSVLLSSLPDKYIEASKNLIKILEENSFTVQFAYWYLRYGENETWVDGEWRLLIASNLGNSCNQLEVYNYLQKILKESNEKIIELSDISITGISEGEIHKHFVLERIDIK